MPRMSRALAWLDVLDVCQNMRRYVCEPQDTVRMSHTLRGQICKDVVLR